jgi:hypothetical protein
MFGIVLLLLLISLVHCSTLKYCKGTIHANACTVDPNCSHQIICGFPTTPASVNGLHMWLRSDVGVQDASGNPSTHSGKVAKWEDQSGNGNDLIQLNSSRMPTYYSNSAVVNLPNNLPTLRFSGSSGEGNNLEWNKNYFLPATWIIAAKLVPPNHGCSSIFGSEWDGEHFYDLNCSGNSSVGTWYLFKI